MSRAVWC